MLALINPSRSAGSSNRCDILLHHQFVRRRVIFFATVTRFFDRDPNVEKDIPAMRKLRVEVVAIPWFVLTTLVLILLIGFWLA